MSVWLLKWLPAKPIDSFLRYSPWFPMMNTLTTPETSLSLVNRRRFLQISALAASFVVVGGALTACSKKDEAKASTVATKLIVGTSISIKALNPLDAVYQTYQFNAFDALVRLLPGDETPEPRIAQSWQQTDTLTWDFQLRDKVKFHDQSFLTAEDVAFSFNEIIGKHLVLASTLSNIASVSVIGPLQVRIVTRTPDPLLMNTISQIFIVPKALYLAAGVDGFGKAPIGSGPYRITAADISSAVQFERFDGFWGVAAVTPQIELRYFSDSTALASALESGQVDVAHDLPANALVTLKGAAGVNLETGFSGNQNMIQFNTLKPPFNDIRVRQAAIAALDVPALIRNLTYGAGLPEDGQLPIRGVFGYSDTLHSPAYDPERAKALLAQSGVQGVTITLSGLALHRTLLEAIGGQLANVGFNPVIEANEAAVWVRQFREGTDADLFYRGTSYVGVFDASRPFSLLTSGKKPMVNDPQWTRLYQASTTEMSPDARKAKLIECSRYLLDQAYILYTYSRPAVNATVEGVKGVDFSKGLIIPFEKASKQV
jgi:peptide/nickel transport system substrate-binding protein